MKKFLNKLFFYFLFLIYLSLYSQIFAKGKYVKLISYENNIDNCVSNSYSSEELGELMRDKVVTIKAYNSESVSLGTGFVVAHYKNQTFFLTNSHVIKDMETINIKWLDGNTDKAILVIDGGGTGDSNDIAILKIAGVVGRPVKLRKNLPKSGRDVIAIGTPKDDIFEYTITKGIISSLRDKGTYIQTDTAINNGNSGGPLIDYSGCVVGMNTSGLDELQGINFAISNKVLNRFVRKVLPGYLLDNDDYPKSKEFINQFNNKVKNKNIQNLENYEVEPDLDYFFID